MAFVSGLMGPYMSPIPINASMGMLISLAIAFTVTPWLALRLLKSHAGEQPPKLMPRSSAFGRCCARWSRGRARRAFARGSSARSPCCSSPRWASPA